MVDLRGVDWKQEGLCGWVLHQCVNNALNCNLIYQINEQKKFKWEKGNYSQTWIYWNKEQKRAHINEVKIIYQRIRFSLSIYHTQGNQIKLDVINVRTSLFGNSEVED